MKTEITPQELEFLLDIPSLVEEKVEEVEEKSEVEEPKKEEVAPEENKIEEPKEVGGKGFVNPKNLIELGLLPSMVVEIDGEEVNLEETENLDKETVREIIKAHNEALEKERKEKYIDKSKFSEEHLNIIKILKTKGDLREVFKTPEEVIEPWQGYDKTSEKHNEAVMMYHFITEKGLSEEEANTLIGIAKKNFTLDTQAEQVVSRGVETYKKAIQEKAELVEKEEKEFKENIRNYSKSLEDIYKEKSLPKEVITKAVKMATTFNTQGDLLIDEQIQEILKDPKKASELILFVNDKDLYDSRIKEDGKKEAHLKSAVRVKLTTNPTGSGAKSENEPSEKVPNFFVL